MGERVAQRMHPFGCSARGVKRSVVTVLGLTFKENVPDTRNSKVVDIVRELQSFGVDGAGARSAGADATDARHEYGIALTPTAMRSSPADAVMLAVAT